MERGVDMRHHDPVGEEVEASTWSSAMKVTIRPALDPQREVDLTRKLVAAIADELWRLYGGNELLNWFEAEQHLARIVIPAPREGRKRQGERSPGGRAPGKALPREAVRVQSAC